MEAFELQDLKSNQERMDKITAIFSRILSPKTKLPEFYYAYIAGIICEEPPTNVQDLYEYLHPYLLDGKAMTPAQGLTITAELHKILLTEKLISGKNTNVYSAEKLEAPLILNEVKIMQEEEDQDTFQKQYFGNRQQTFFFPTKEIAFGGTSEKAKKKREKQQEKNRLAYEQFQREKQEELLQLSRPQVHHGEKSGNMDIDLFEYTVTVGGRDLLKEADVKFNFGKRYGLIGRNGIGKTVLMNSIAGRAEGLIPNHISILLVEQEIVASQQTVVETVLEVDTERAELLKRENEIVNSEKDDDLEELNQIFSRLDAIDAKSTEPRVRVLLNGLGFTNEMMNQPTIHLSGGWKMRVALARALFAKPDVLLLDEPTNHLDLDATLWLEDYLQTWTNTLVVVSHARNFLNAVCTDIIDFRGQKLNYYRGNYDTFEKVRAERIKQKRRQQESQHMKMAHVQKFIDKFRFNAKRASLVQSRIKALKKMKHIEQIIDDPTCIFIFKEPEILRPPIIKIDDGVFGYTEDSVLLKSINLKIDMETRMTIVGGNGVGKTTLLKILNNDLKLRSGQIYSHNRLRIAFFTQHHVDSLELTLSPLEQMIRDYKGHTQESFRNHLGSFGVTGDMALRPMYLLSGGQKSRVAFALAVWSNPHIMIMDEPSNHLDLDAINALIIALRNFQGGLLIVSHDQHLISSVCTDIMYIKEQRLKRFKGNFDEYKMALVSQKI